MEFVVPSCVSVKCSKCGYQEDLTLEEYFNHQEMIGRIENFHEKLTCIYRLEPNQSE